MSAPIDGCRLRYECPMQWDSLERVGRDPKLRFCGQCQSAVHWADTEAEALALGRQGKCVALGFFEHLTMGHVEVPVIFPELPDPEGDR
jgi:hypothetical protein